MSTIKVTAAERKRLEHQRVIDAVYKASITEDRKREKEAKKAAKIADKERADQKAALEAKRLEGAKKAHAKHVSHLYGDHVVSLARGTAARLKTLAGGLVAFSDTASSPSSNSEQVIVANTRSLEGLLEQANVDPRLTFKAPEFVPPAPLPDFNRIQGFDLAGLQQGKSASYDALQRMHARIERDILKRAMMETPTIYFDPAAVLGAQFSNHAPQWATVGDNQPRQED